MHVKTEHFLVRSHIAQTRFVFIKENFVSEGLVEKLKNTIQDCNINFLIGSGLSCPYLSVLGNIEKLLTDLDNNAIPENQKKIIRVSLYKLYFDRVIAKNIKILDDDDGCVPVMEQYKAFLHCLNSVLIKRKVTILGKEVNLFTTNIDIFLDKALEQLNLEYNDGFNGRFKPSFSLSNFKISRFKKSLYYDKTAELPVFNLVKLHGSLSWEIKKESVLFSVSLQHIKEIETKVLPADHLVDISDGATIPSLIAGLGGKKVSSATDAFMEAYERLLMVVNPTKEKFRHSLMNQTYYELLRLYSNELEKENTILFAMGFSFADEHIREITLRAANSNPTLMIYVVAYTSEAKTQIEAALGPNTIRNNNIKIVAPDQEDDGAGGKKDAFKHDFTNINSKIFRAVLHSVDADN
jgi:hypothetical protein